MKLRQYQSQWGGASAKVDPSLREAQDVKEPEAAMGALRDYNYPMVAITASSAGFVISLIQLIDVSVRYHVLAGWALLTGIAFAVSGVTTYLAVRALP